MTKRRAVMRRCGTMTSASATDDLKIKVVQNPSSCFLVLVRLHTLHYSSDIKSLSQGCLCILLPTIWLTIMASWPISRQYLCRSRRVE